MLLSTRVVLFFFSLMLPTTAFRCRTTQVDLLDGTRLYGFVLRLDYSATRPTAPRNCDVIIGEEPNTTIALTIKALSIPLSPNCSEGSLSVYSLENDELDEFCGVETPFTKTYSRSSVRLLFEVKGSLRRARFTVEFKSIPFSEEGDVGSIEVTETESSTDILDFAAFQFGEVTEECNNALSPVYHDDIKMYGGLVFYRGSWPWIASLKRKGQSHFCAASLISRYVLITSAQCFQRGHFINETVVRLGTDKPDTEREYEIEKVVVHPDYSSVDLSNDVALIKLQTPVDISDSICPISLPDISDELPYQATVFTAGWNNVTTNDTQNSPSGLLSALLHVTDQTTCRAIHKERLTDNMICASDYRPVGAVCRSDIGSPLIRLKNGLRVLVGVASWSDGCDRPSNPGVYTRLANYMDWISNNIRND